MNKDNLIIDNFCFPDKFPKKKYNLDKNYETLNCNTKKKNLSLRQIIKDIFYLVSVGSKNYLVNKNNNRVREKSQIKNLCD